MDMLLFTSILFHSKPLPYMQKRLGALAAASLAVWDPIVCQQLSLGNIEAILDPNPILRQIADERGWQFAKSGSQDYLWQKGEKAQDLV